MDPAGVTHTAAPAACTMGRLPRGTASRGAEARRARGGSVAAPGSGFGLATRLAACAAASPAAAAEAAAAWLATCAAAMPFAAAAAVPKGEQGGVGSDGIAGFSGGFARRSGWTALAMPPPRNSTGCSRDTDSELGLQPVASPAGGKNLRLSLKSAGLLSPATSGMASAVEQQRWSRRRTSRTAGCEGVLLVSMSICMGTGAPIQPDIR